MKKKVVYMLCALMAWSSQATAVSAEQHDVAVTTSVMPTYTVTIPADTNIAFNATQTDFGKIELTRAQLEPGYAVRVSAATTALTNQADVTKTIPYALNANGKAFTSAEYQAVGDSTALTIDITKADWNQAAAGQYKGTVTFTVAYVPSDA